MGGAPLRITISDVARYAGVSTATVSRVLNGNGRVGPDTHSRVEQAIEALNYTPNLAARQMETGRSFMVGLVLPDIVNPFFPLVARGVADVARQHGYTMVLANSDGDPVSEAEAIRALVGRRVDGVIVAQAGPEPGPWLTDLHRAGVPVVLMDRPVEGPLLDTVIADNRSGGVLMARHLIELGHRQLGFIGGPARLASSAERYDGFIATAREMGAVIRPESIVIGDFQLLSGFQAMQHLIALTERPTAVGCANDLMALGALRALRQAGLSVPGDLALVGFDDIPMAAMSDPALTTVAQPAYRMGSAAMERLLARTDGRDTNDTEPVAVRLPVKLIVRESCGAGKRGQPLWL